MPYQLYYKTPDMSRGANVSAGVGFTSLWDIQDFLKYAPTEMPENTLFYYRERLQGQAWIVRDGKVIEIWSPRIYKKYKLPMPQIMAAAINMSLDEINETLH